MGSVKMFQAYLDYHSYAKVRGLAQYLRLLLSYTKADFEEVQYADREKWFDHDKLNLGLEFPNLPYLIEGDFKLTESSVIAKYIIARSQNKELLGKNIVDQANVNTILGVLDDALKEVRGLFYNKEYEAAKGAAFDKAKPKLDYLKHFIGNNSFALGYITLADFLIAEHAYYFDTLYPEHKSQYSFFFKIRSHFNALPEIRAYYERPDAVKGPFTSSMAALQIPVPKTKLGYWNCRGQAQVSRLLLAYTVVEFENIAYTDADTWFKKDKLDLGMDFPNLPYLIDGPVSLSETTAINQYIIGQSKHKQLLGKDFHDAARLGNFLSVFEDVRRDVSGLFWNPEHEKASPAIIEKNIPKLNLLQKFIGEKQFILGYLTLADFYVAEFSIYMIKIFPDAVAKWPFLATVQKNFNQLPEIKAYYQQPTAFKGPYIPPSAKIQV